MLVFLLHGFIPYLLSFPLMMIQELAAAVDMQKPIVPVIIDNVVRAASFGTLCCTMGDR